MPKAVTGDNQKQPFAKGARTFEGIIPDANQLLRMNGCNAAHFAHGSIFAAGQVHVISVVGRFGTKPGATA